MILANLITTVLSSPWMAALGGFYLLYYWTHDMKDKRTRFLICASAALVAAGMIYPIHKNIQEEHERKMREPIPMLPGESLLDYSTRAAEERRS